MAENWDEVHTLNQKNDLVQRVAIALEDLIETSKRDVLIEDFLVGKRTDYFLLITPEGLLVEQNLVLKNKPVVVISKDKYKDIIEQYRLTPYLLDYHKRNLS